MGESGSRSCRVFAFVSVMALEAIADGPHLSDKAIRSNLAPEPLAVAGDLNRENGPYSEAIGRSGGCTGTIVSAPGTPVVVLRASHCGGADTFVSSTRRVGGLKCFTNRDWAQSNAPDDDIQLCFSQETTTPGFIGCFDPQPQNPVRLNEELRFFGHGNPMWDRPMVAQLHSGVTRVQRLTRGFAMFAAGAAVVTKGDSGGPVARAAQYAQAMAAGFFGIVGVNSVRAGGSSGFAPISASNLNFVGRAIARVQSELGIAARICGVNYQPGGAIAPAQPLPSPQPTFGQPSPSPFMPRGIMPPPSGFGGGSEGQRLTDHLHRIGGFISEKIATREGGFRFEKLFGSANGVPFGTHGPMTEDAQKGLVGVYCQQGFDAYMGQRLQFALAFLARRRGEVDAACFDRVVRPALARAARGNALADQLRDFTPGPGAGAPPVKTPVPSAPHVPAPLPLPPIGITIIPMLPTWVPTALPTAFPAFHADIDRYENGMKYMDGTPRERFHADTFKDVPQGGTGKLILAYWGDRDDPSLHALAAGNPLVEVRRYAWGSPEQRFNPRTQAVALDGLGRKITRYAFSPIEAFRSLMGGEEPVLLERYLRAKGSRSTAPIPSPIATFAPMPSFAPPSASRPGTASADAPASLHSAITGKCVSCHGRSAPAFPEFVKDWGRWESLLNAGDPEAKRWLSRFNDKVVNGNMLALSGLSTDHGPGKDIVDLIGGASHRFGGPVPPKSDAIRHLGSPEASYMINPAKREEYFNVLLGSNIANPELQKALLEFDGMWDSEGSPAWSWAPIGGDSGRKGQRPVDREPSSPVMPHLFENVDGKWQWKKPFNKGFAQGKDTRGIKSFFLIRFPRDEAGNLIKGVRGTESHLSHRDLSSSNGYASSPREGTPDIWASFPEGTRVMEILYSTSLGEPVLVDVLSREKRISPGGQTVTWVPDAHRIDASPDKIRKWVQSQPDATTNPDLAKILAAVGTTQSDSIRSNLGAGNSGGAPFVVDGARTNVIHGSKSVLPPGISRETLLRMYKTMPQTSAAGSDGWQLEVQDVYAGAHRGIKVDSKTCANCHGSAGESFQSVFAEAGLPTTSVSAYGNVGGYDGVLSAPWFNREALNEYGQRVRTDMRPEWGKFFEDYDPSRHSANRYLRTVPWGMGDRPLTRPR